MSKPPSKRAPSARKRMVLMSIAVIVVFGGVFAIKAFFAKQTNTFFDNMQQPAVAVSSSPARTQRWTDRAYSFFMLRRMHWQSRLGGVALERAMDGARPRIGAGCGA